jgi:hypothetical protein
MKLVCTIFEASRWTVLRLSTALDSDWSGAEAVRQRHPEGVDRERSMTPLPASGTRLGSLSVSHP